MGAGAGAAGVGAGAGVPGTGAAPAGGPTTEEKPIEKYGTLNLLDPLAVRLAQRSIWNCCLPWSAASRFGVQLAWDGAECKKGPRLLRKWTMMQVRPAPTLPPHSTPTPALTLTLARRPQLRVCCNGVPVSGGWGEAAIRHALRNSHSTDMSTIISAYQGNDHRANQEKYIAEYVKMVDAAPSITVPYLLQRKPPIMYDENFNIEESRLHRWQFKDGKYIPSPPPKKQTDEFVVVENVPFKLNWQIGVDLSAAMSAAGECYSANSKSSPFNETVHKDQHKIAQVPALATRHTSCQSWQEEGGRSAADSLYRHCISSDYPLYTHYPGLRAARRLQHSSGVPAPLPRTGPRA